MPFLVLRSLVLREAFFFVRIPPGWLVVCAVMHHAVIELYFMVCVVGIEWCGWAAVIVVGFREYLKTEKLKN